MANEGRRPTAADRYQGFLEARPSPDYEAALAAKSAKRLEEHLNEHEELKYLSTAEIIARYPDLYGNQTGSDSAREGSPPYSLTPSKGAVPFSDVQGVVGRIARELLKLGDVRGISNKQLMSTITLSAGVPCSLSTMSRAKALVKRRPLG